MTSVRTMIARGLPLAERRAAVGGEPEHGNAAQRLARWRSQSPFDEDSWWQARLAAAGLTEQQLLALLAGPGPGAATPGAGLWWLDWVGRLVDGDGQDQATTGESAGEIYFSALVMPLVAQAQTRLLTRLRAVPGSAGVLDPVRMTRSLSAGLAAALDRMVLRALVAELERMRLAGQLRGGDAGARFAEFATALAQPPQRRELFGRYPVLARQLAVEAGGWLERCIRFVGHLTADTHHVSAVFGGGREVGLVEEVVPGLGDRHSAGTVTLVRWTGGLELIYKPRSLALDVHFRELADWVRKKGLSYPLCTAACTDLGDHGWVEVVRPQACADQAQLRRFYHRQGSLLALLYLLGATDMHAENLIAVGEHPVVVDLETLVQPELPARARARARVPAEAAVWEAVSSSVLTVGLLPQRSPGSRAGGPADVSGLGWAPGQRAPLPVPAVRDPRTDRMRVELAAPQLPLPAHRPVAEDASLRLLDYSADILAGFTEVYHLCQDNKAELASGPLAAFSGDRVRVVVRHSVWYAAILSMSFHPDVLRDALDREQFLDVLWREAPRSPTLAACAEHERADVWRNDIPLFTAATDSTVLLDSQHRPVANLTLTPGMDRLRGRLAKLGPDDLARQRWLIASTLGTTGPAQGMPGRRITVATPPALSGIGAASAPARACLLSAAEAIGRRLHQIAFRQAGSAQWLGISSPGGVNWSVGPLRADLYHGLTGVALFLGHLGELTGDSTHTELARHALRTALAQLDDDPVPRDGGLAGAGGIIHALCELARLWDEDSILRAAEAHARRAAPAADDVVFDFTAGSAGTIAGLLTLHQVRPSDRLASQVKACADRLLATAIQRDSGIGWLPAQPGDAVAPPVGYAHGNAGIIPSLLLAADLLGDDRYRQAADEALAYEQAFFSADSGTWDDARCYPGLPTSLTQAAARGTSWCRGAAGIGISRLFCLTLVRDQHTCRRDIDAALAAASQATWRSHCLCHGGAGTLELYLHAATLRDPRWRYAADQHAAAILASIDRHGWRCGTPLHAQTPGLMVGLAGIGYGLLRAADPARVPSALTLQPPLQQARSKNPHLAPGKEPGPTWQPAADRNPTKER